MSRNIFAARFRLAYLRLIAAPLGKTDFTTTSGGTANILAIHYPIEFTGKAFDTCRFA